jgi:hypothetical protein
MRSTTRSSGRLRANGKNTLASKGTASAQLEQARSVGCKCQAVSSGTDALLETGGMAMIAASQSEPSLKRAIDAGSSDEDTALVHNVVGDEGAAAQLRPLLRPLEPLASSVKHSRANC